MRRFLSYLTLLAMTACVYPFSPELTSETDGNILVVSGDIIAGQVSEIRLGYVSPLGSLTSTTKNNIPKSGAVRLVSKGTGQTIHGKASRSVYSLDTGSLSPDDEYKLHISCDGEQYETPFMKVCPAPEITDLDYVTDDSRLTLRISLDGGESLSDFRWDYTEDWEYHAYYVPDLMFNPGYLAYGIERPEVIYRLPLPEEDYYYCWNNAENMQPYTAGTADRSRNVIEDLAFRSISRSDARLSVLYTIEVTARGLTPDGRAYLDHVSSTSNITGDLFTPIPSNVQGNIRCVSDSTRTAVGYVSCSRFTTKRIFVNSAGIYRQAINPESFLYTPEMNEDDGLYHFDDLWNGGDAPVKCSSMEVPKVPTRTNVTWGPKWCTDCRASGGSKNKPEWWPNNHK